VSACISRVDSGAADVAEMRAKVVERVRQFYTWNRITDHYCELISLVGSKARGQRETIHCAPLDSTSPVPIKRAEELAILRHE